MKIIGAIIPTYLVMSFHRNQKQETCFQEIGGLVTRNVPVFIYSESCSTSRHVEFNRLLQRNFLTCYSYSYYSSMVEVKEI